MKLEIIIKKTVTIVLYLTILMTICGQVAASDQKLVFGTVNNFPPFAYRLDGKLTGIDIDLVNEAAKRIGVSIEIMAFPWVRVMKSVENGSIDGGFAAFRTAEREAFCLYTDILHYEEFQIFVRKGNEFRYSDMSDLYGKMIGKDRGVFVSEEFETAAQEGKIKLEEISDMTMPKMRKLLNAGILDAAIGDLGVMMYHIKSLGMDRDIIPIGPVGKKTGAYLVISKSSPIKDKVGLQKKFQSALQQIKKDGTYRKIFERHTQ